MGVSATFKKDSQRYEVTLRRSGKRVRRLAPVGMGKREAIRQIGDQLIVEMEQQDLAEVEAEQPPTLWDFCKDVYAEKHGVNDRTWHQRKFKVAGVAAHAG